jgi:hypothetical protein
VSAGWHPIGRTIFPKSSFHQMHDLHVERFYKAQVINGLIAPSGGDGRLKTQVLRGARDMPTYLHDGRLMTLDDSVKFFKLILGAKLTPQGKGSRCVPADALNFKKGGGTPSRLPSSICCGNLARNLAAVCVSAAR